MLGNRMNDKEACQGKIKTTWRKVSKLSELLKGVMKNGMPKKYNKLPISETKQRLTALANCMKTRKQ